MQMFDKLPILRWVRKPIYFGICLLLSACTHSPSLPKTPIVPTPSPTPLPNTSIIVKSITRPVFGYYDDRFLRLYGYVTTTEENILNADKCGGRTRVINGVTFTGVIDNGNDGQEAVSGEELDNFSYCK